MENTNINFYKQYMYSYPHKKTYKWVESEVILKGLNSIENTRLSLYFHIPFCSTKCGYCNLFSVTNLSLINDYIEAMCRQIKQYGEILKNKNIIVENIIFGGGTPFILSCENFDEIFNALQKDMGVNIKNVVFDIETSPKETDESKLKYLIEKGINRISIGVQSFNEKELKYIYRMHTVDECKKALDCLNTHRPKVLNIDIIYGIPNQNSESLKNSIDEALKYNPEEIFAYPLYIREGTGLVGKEDMPDSEKYQLYLFVSKYLKEKGYTQTSMRRFTKLIATNENNCGFEQTLSFGCGGRSYINDLHFCEAYETGVKACTNIIEKFIDKIDFTKDIKGYVLNKEEQSRRFIIKNLGYYKGISKSEYFKYFNEDVEVTYKDLIDKFIIEGYLEKDYEYIFLTEKGIGLSDYLLDLFTSEAIQKEM